MSSMYFDAVCTRQAAGQTPEYFWTVTGSVNEGKVSKDRGNLRLFVTKSHMFPKLFKKDKNTYLLSYYVSPVYQLLNVRYCC